MDIFLGILVICVIDAGISFEFYNVAVEKGYKTVKYFWLCFFFLIIGYLLVIALPDRTEK